SQFTINIFIKSNQRERLYGSGASPPNNGSVYMPPKAPRRLRPCPVRKRKPVNSNWYEAVRLINDKMKKKLQTVVLKAYTPNWKVLWKKHWENRPQTFLFCFFV
ncbi:MAG: hypothetical protein ACFFE4_11895, partial [Candidatus Thorarchaeota archaeon]